MMLEATPKNIGWLLTQLYEASRALEADSVSHPVFVLVTKSEAERQIIENRFYQYFNEKYGVEPRAMIVPEVNSHTLSSFQFPGYGFRVVLIDIELEKET